MKAFETTIKPLVKFGEGSSLCAGEKFKLLGCTKVLAGYDANINPAVVDAVIGSHPHVVQEAGLPVIYSLGNFISNMSRRDTRLGLMYRLDIAVTSFGWSFLAGGEAIPVWCARAGEFEAEYTVLPIKEYLEREDEFRNKYIYQNMKDTYNRLKSLFEK